MRSYKDTHVRQELKPEQLCYLSGGTTEVRVIGDFDSKKPLCLVVKVSPVSKFKVGDVVSIKRVNLARNKRRGVKGGIAPAQNN